MIIKITETYNCSVIFFLEKNMRTFIFNDNKIIKINNLFQLEFISNNNAVFNSEMIINLLMEPLVSENIIQNDGCYYAKTDEIEVLGFRADIAKHPHPAVSLAYAFSWYNSNIGGVYLIGIDNKKNEYFAPLKKSL